MKRILERLQTKQPAAQQSAQDQRAREREQFEKWNQEQLKRQDEKISETRQKDQIAKQEAQERSEQKYRQEAKLHGNMIEDSRDQYAPKASINKEFYAQAFEDPVGMRLDKEGIDALMKQVGKQKQGQQDIQKVYGKMQQDIYKHVLAAHKYVIDANVGNPQFRSMPSESNLKLATHLNFNKLAEFSNAHPGVSMNVAAYIHTMATAEKDFQGSRYQTVMERVYENVKERSNLRGYGDNLDRYVTEKLQHSEAQYHKKFGSSSEQRQGSQRRDERATETQVKDALDLLGVDHKDATEKTIDKAFKKSMIQWHPDKNPNEQEMAQEKSVQITSAKELLDKNPRIVDDVRVSAESAPRFHR